MKKVVFNENINDALNSSKKKFNFKERFIENLKNNLKNNKIILALFVTSTLLFQASPFLFQLLLLPASLVTGFKSLSNIVFKGFADTYVDKINFDKERENAKRIIEAFKRNVLVKNNVYVKEDCYLKNIGTYSKKKLIENVSIKKEEKTTNNYFKFKDREDKIHVLRQIKKELLEDGISKKVLSTDYELLDFNEANIELKKEKGKIK